MDENLRKIKEIILNIAKEMNIEIYKIILFGSRARGDYREDSDYDLLIITKEKLEKEKYWDFYSNLSKNLTEKIEAPIEILVIDKNEFEKRKKYKGFIYFWANKEGIII
ncbi:MAG: nucleotidyltransferase domain-containing protein [Candidatus Aenigmatarchaeota archaeon]